MNSVDYKQKAKNILSDTKTYILPKNPTAKYTSTLLKKLQELKQADAITELDYKRVYPTSTTIPRFYGFPKVHMAGAPLRPIVASRGSITYVVVRRIADILAPLVGKNGYALKNSAELVRQLNDCQLDKTDVLVLFGVTALLTCVPIDQSLDVILTSCPGTLPCQHTPPWQLPWYARHLPQNHVLPLRRCHLQPSGKGLPWGRPWVLSSLTSSCSGLRSQPSRPSSMSSPSGTDTWTTLWWGCVTICWMTSQYTSTPSTQRSSSHGKKNVIGP